MTRSESELEVDDGARARPRAWWVGLRAPLATASVFWVAFIVRAADVGPGRPGYTLADDAMISMRFARNLARGDGAVWQPGVSVEGYTNPLWTFWMAVLHRLGLPGPLVVLTIVLTGLVLLVVAVVLIAKVADAVGSGDRRVRAVAVWLTALCYPLTFWTLRGMEVGLLAVLVIAAVLVLVRGDPPTPARLAGCVALGAATALVRPDALVLTGPALVVAACAITDDAVRRRAGAIGGGLIAGTALMSVLRMSWYGSLTPNTYLLKVGGTTLAERLPRGAAAVVALFATVLLPALLAGLGLLVMRGRARRLALIAVTPFVTAVGYSIAVGGDAWEYMPYANRYVTPALPLLFVAAGMGVVVLAELSTEQIRWVARGGLIACLAIAAVLVLDLAHTIGVIGIGSVGQLRGAVAALGAVPLALLLLVPPERLRGILVPAVLAATLLMAGALPVVNWIATGGYNTREDSEYGALGLALHDALPPGTTIAVVRAGALSYDADLPTVDQLGKVDAHIAAEGTVAGFVTPGHDKWDVRWSIGALAPAVIIDLPGPTARPEDVAYVRSLGYQEVLVTDAESGRHVLVLPDRVDPAAVAEAVRRSGF